MHTNKKYKQTKKKHIDKGINEPEKREEWAHEQNKRK